MNRRPRWLPWAAAVVTVALFSGLGVWQLQRAAEKRAVLTALDAGDAPVVETLPSAVADLRSIERRRLSLRGRFEGGRQFLLDNRILEGRPGVDVLTPLRLPDGRRILVDRGWIPIGAGREPVGSTALETHEPVTVEGRLWLPEEGIGLGSAVADREDWPRQVTRIEFPALEAALGTELVPAVVRAHGDADWLYRPRDLRPRFGPMRHYGYAFQWFALAITVLALACILEWRHQRTDRR